MLPRLLTFLRHVRFFALFLVLPLGWFAWGTLTGTRLLGDDNESTETLGTGNKSHGRTGHGLYFHK